MNEAFPASAAMVAHHPAAAALLGGPALPGRPPLIDPEANLDTLFAPSELIQVVDADASQTRLLETAQRRDAVAARCRPGTDTARQASRVPAWS